MLAEYNSPKDKIAYMEKKKEIIRLKKGLYVSSPAIHKQLLSRELIANHLMGHLMYRWKQLCLFMELYPKEQKLCVP